MPKHPGYEYKTTSVWAEKLQNEKEVVDNALVRIANKWAEKGWRTVTLVPAGGDVIFLMERRKPNPFNRDGAYVENQRWHDWEEQYGEGGVR